MATFHLKIVTPRGIYRDEDVEMLNLRTSQGQIGILANHIPLATDIEISEMNYIQNGERYHFAIGGGFVYIDDKNTVTVIGNSVESPEEIDLRRAQEAKDRAEKRLQSTDIDIQRAEIALKKSLIRIQVKNM